MRVMVVLAAEEVGSVGEMVAVEVEGEAVVVEEVVKQAYDIMK